jgi:hypothetical protein
MKMFLVAIGFSVFSACAQTPHAEKVSYEISPGEIRFIHFPVQHEKSRLICRDSEIKYARTESGGRAFVIESYFSELKPFSCKVMAEGKTLHEMHFMVKDKEYHAEQLRVDSKRIKLSKKNQDRAWKEQQVLDKIYASSSSKLLFSEPFIAPMNSHVTSVYGTRRVYNKQKKGQHLGIDYRAAIGDKVPAVNSGKVVFAGDLFYTGWTVIIDHGLDIFSVYGHLSKTLVKKGDMVKRGDLIALSGNTGRTSGPHLHWGMKVQGQYIDGLVLVSETTKMFPKQ